MAVEDAGNTSRYLNGQYFIDNPDWHEDDSQWKFDHISNIIDRNGLSPQSICEVGCGGGGIVQLAARRYTNAQVEGFEISPQAFERCETRRSANLGFTLGSPFGQERIFDLCMAIDVIEHVENPFDFIRDMRDISRWQLFHIPLDMNALSVGRGWVIPEARTKIGHLHYFTRETAFATLQECGLEIVDSFYTPWAIDQSYKTMKKRIAAWPRRIAYSLYPDATVRLVGGWSLMVLARPAE